MGQLTIQPNVEEQEFVQYAEFLSLITEIENVLKDITDISIAAEHNKRTCNALKQRVYESSLMILDLRAQQQGADDQKEIFNKKNYFYLQNLIFVIKNIKDFMSEISQTKTLLDFIKSKSIKKTFNKLCDDFDVCMIDLSIATAITTTTTTTTATATAAAIESNPDKEELKDNEEVLIKSLENIEEVGDHVRELRNTFSSMVLLMDEMANIKVQQLKISDFNETNKKPRKGGRVTKWVDARNKCGEFAFKDISENKNSIQNQVLILKELHNCQNVLKFYGITCDGNKWYSVIEWAEYGNLREFYTNYKYLFDIKLKLRMSLDIARGLSFLRSVEIVHRDIRAENVLITLNDTAKIANFKLCRKLRTATFTAPAFKQTRSIERDRYCAPELLEKVPYLKYDYNCEVYSFGILLWEIAEEKTPYKDCEDKAKITNLARNGYRESFSENSAMPEKFKNLSINAVDHDPESRPKITTMFEVLGDCFESYERLSRTHTLSNLVNSSKNHQNGTTPEHTPKKRSLMQKLLSYDIFK